MPEVHVTDEQGTEHIFPDGSTPDMISRAMNLRPGIPRPSVNMQQVDITGKPQNHLAGLAGVPGGSPNPTNPSNAELAAIGLPIGAAATVMGGATALPFLAASFRAHPIAGPLVAQEAISQLRKIPVVGKHVPAFAEMLPWLVGGKRKPGGAPDATRENVPYAGEEAPTMKPGGEPDATRGNEPYAGEDYAAQEAGAQAKPPGFGFKQGRLVLSPEEAQSEDQIQAIAKDRASKRGMRYAGGIKPKGTMAQVSQ